MEVNGHRMVIWGNSVLRLVQPLTTKFKVGRYFRFLLVGTVNAATDLLVLNLCLWINPTTNWLDLLVYNTIAVFCAIVISYELNRRWTFSDRSRNPRQEKRLFFAQGVLNVAINNSSLVLFTRLFYNFDLPYLISSNLSKVMAMAISSTISYSILRKFVYRI